MKLFEIIETTGHDQVLYCRDQESGLRAIIAIHDAGLGLAMGATRLWPYASEMDALRDVLRLSRGMTYKAACANIPVGGGKAVIMARPEDKTSRLLRAYGRFVESLNGHFITGQDVNLTPQDVRQIRLETRHVVGTAEKSGGPAPITAIGVLQGIKAAVEFRLNRQDVDGLKVAIQGLGNVGKHLCQRLYAQGAELFVSDLDEAKTDEVKRLYGATVVKPDEIFSLDVDVFSPCALGGVLNSTTIPSLKAFIVAGCANNQLEDEQAHSKLLELREILYCPDYVINAGGLINVYHEMIGYEEEKALRHVDSIYNTLLEIFEKAERERITTHQAAHRLSEARIAKAKHLKTFQARSSSIVDLKKLDHRLR